MTRPVQNVEIVSAKQFGADPSFGGQAVQIASDLRSKFFRTKSKKSCAGFLASARTQIVSEFQIRLSIERSREHAKRIGPAMLLLQAADHDGGSGS
jgi:hypothetical protein